MPLATTRLELMANDLIGFADEPGLQRRVLWIGQPSGLVALLDVSTSGTWPELVGLDETMEDLKLERTRLLPTPMSGVAKRFKPTALAIQQGENRWHCIETIVGETPGLFSTRTRELMVKEVCERHGVSRKAVTNWLQLYWRRGMTPDALIADRANQGCRGQTKPAGAAKRGRPRKFGHRSGLNVDDAVRRTFSLSIHRCYAKNRKLSKTDAYAELLRSFYYEEVHDRETGASKHVLKPPFDVTGPPTKAQFDYWFERQNDLFDLAKKRMGPRKYELTQRGVTGSATARTWGPGCRYEIDATIGNVYLVSRLDRRQIVGRPVIYLIIDVFSRMIVGIYVGIENPSWASAMMAVVNLVEDKVEFCKRFGIDIDEAAWPIPGLPDMLLSDRGEIEHKVSERLFKAFNVVSEVAAAFRADWKGIVERHFELIDAKFGAYVPGYVEPDFLQRGGRDYRAEATLNIDEFTAIILHCVVHYNNHHELGGYDADADVVRDRVPLVPAHLYAWGRVNRSGVSRRYPPEQVKFELMPDDDATVTQRGIRFRKAFYTCQRAEDELWFDRARQRGSWKVRVSYDPRCMDNIYLHDGERQGAFDVCSLLARSRAWAGLGEVEIGAASHVASDDAADRLLDQGLARADMTEAIKAIVTRAEGDRPEMDKGEDSGRAKAIRANRAEERAATRDREAFRLGEAARVETAPPAGAGLPSVTGNVGAKASGTHVPDVQDCSAPDIADLMDLLENDDA